ncbi:putative plastid-lipid-associated protein 8 [Morus notabilis]|uniref:Putative plastid-lipid-associated protein 8 n=1 Tax=Morus notabilis TaxID=981085 RepID=W9RSE6_9ROSA|nr:putative plastid-lipid-associated protein 8 [Morus notabilis]
MAASASSLALPPSSRPKLIGFHFHGSKPTNLVFSISSHSHNFRSQRRNLRVLTSVSVPNIERRIGPDNLIPSILYKVTETDRGVLLKKEEHQKVAEVTQEAQKFCVSEPVKCPLIFGGKLKALDDEWVQVIFEPPILKVGPFEFRYGGESEVKLQITYIDENVRLGKGSRGSLFVFQRRN